MNWNTLHDMKLKDARVLTRVDLNVPTEKGVVSDSTRIERIKPTIKYILKKGGTPVLIAHYGRPAGKEIPEMSLRFLVPKLEEVLGSSVTFTTLNNADKTIKLNWKKVILIENIRFEPGEQINDLGLAQRIADLGDLYCNDAFSAAHRAHASTVGVAYLLPSCAGLLMSSELDALEAALGDPERPLVAVVGGAKVSTKINLLENLIKKVDHLVIGGAMANTFIGALGHNVGKSLYEISMTATAKRILSNAKKSGCEIILPSDVIAAKHFEKNSKNISVNSNACPPDHMILDTGSKTVARISECLSKAKTVVWNGPLGAFEIKPFDRATNLTM
ncbi:MAG: phosphoglycerate kinase, partial [Planktomarina sp.]|nr:phosphoglycerate kinase [Planktomarina sp.]